MDALLWRAIAEGNRGMIEEPASWINAWRNATLSGWCGGWASGLWSRMTLTEPNIAHACRGDSAPTGETPQLSQRALGTAQTDHYLVSNADKVPAKPDPIGHWLNKMNIVLRHAILCRGVRVAERCMYQGPVRDLGQTASSMNRAPRRAALATCRSLTVSRRIGT